MNQFLAVLRDTLHEALDQRSLLFVLLLSAAVVGATFGLSPRANPPEEVLERCAQQLGRFRLQGSLGSRFTATMPIEIERLGLRTATADDPLPPALQAMPVVEIELEHELGLDAAITSWESFKIRRVTGHYPDPPNPPPAHDAGDRTGFLEERFREHGYSHVQAWQAEDPRVFFVAARASDPFELVGGYTLGFFGGRIEIPLEESSVVDFLFGVQKGIVAGLGGFFGLLILISCTAGFVPGMLKKGTVDLVLARPISRSRLLLCKYLAMVCLVAVFAVGLFVAETYAIERSTGLFNPWLVGCALVMTANFAILFSLSTLAGVIARSPAIATPIPVVVWGLAFLAGKLHHEGGTILADHPVIRQWIAGAYHLLPNLIDLTDLCERISARPFAAATEARLTASLPDVNWWLAGGSTALFTLAALALAFVFLRRKDL